MLEKAGVRASIDVVISKSSAAEGIIDFAKEAGADFIIIGTKGLTGVERFLMGGVADSCDTTRSLPSFGSEMINVEFK